VTPHVVLGRAAGTLPPRALGDEAVRRALRRLGLREGLSLGRTVEGAPRAWLGPLPLPVWLSLSHSGGRAVAAASRGVRVGLDILAGPLEDPGLWEDFFTGPERTLLQGMDDGLRVGFSAKEAAWKALEGAGPSELRHYAVSLQGHGPRGHLLGTVTTVLERGPRAGSPATLQLRSWTSRGDRVSLCTESAP
jgi:phosphopantetheinyl transferase (holo-ACP synthase)